MRPVDVFDDAALAIQLDRQARGSLKSQVIEQMRQAVMRGQLAPGRKLPASRTLAAWLRVSRALVEDAYDELVAQGYLARRHGSGTYVESAIPQPAARAPIEVPAADHWLRRTWAEATLPTPPQDVIAFVPGATDVTRLPEAVWRAVWRKVGAEVPPGRYGGPAGDPALRAALAHYLQRTRGLSCAADEIIVTAGAMQALDLLARATLRPSDAVAFEEPGYTMARYALSALGARIVSIAVDDDGLDVAALDRLAEAPLLAYVTPSHQFPLGVRLPVSRRIALLAWAARNDSLIIEDDYDSEYRFDAPPLPALASLDNEGRVAYIGTLSKTLSPALRMGYLVVRQAALRHRLLRLRTVTDYHASWPVQRACLALIQEGHLERHVWRMRRVYAEKRELLCGLLAPLAPNARVRGLESGLHVYLELSSKVDAQDIAQRTRQQKVVVLTVAEFYHGEPRGNGLVLGYGGLSLAQIGQGARVLRDVIRRAADANSAEARR